MYDKLFYSKTTNGFYLQEIHGSSIPLDAVEISREYYQELLHGETEGKSISSDPSGNPVLIERPDPTADQLKELAIAQDKAYLASTDYVVSKISEAQALGQDIQPLLAKYADVLTEREAARERIRGNQE